MMRWVRPRLRSACAALAVFAMCALPVQGAGGCRILVTDDDGIGAPGIAALYRSLKDICDVLVVAPATDRSGASHAIPDARLWFAARPAEAMTPRRVARGA